MDKECESIEKCGFFKKYKETKALACRGFVRRYCKGPQQNECKRKKYSQEHGTPPSNDMMPNGQMIVA
ncbi:MAG: hypothetical protein KKD05_02100 [Candidatus Omnitrophica bacterium]|nr:hypothetical protein [Candidatus Omnitrophota bacterium]